MMTMISPVFLRTRFMQRSVKASPAIDPALGEKILALPVGCFVFVWIALISSVLFVLLTFIELFREVKMNSWKVLSSQRPKVTTDCLNHWGDMELCKAPKLQPEQLAQQFVTSDRAWPAKRMCCEVHWWGENGGWKKTSHPQKLQVYSLVVMLTQGYELGYITM